MLGSAYYLHLESDTDKMLQILLKSGTRKTHKMSSLAEMPMETRRLSHLEWPGIYKLLQYKLDTSWNQANNNETIFEKHGSDKMMFIKLQLFFKTTTDPIKSNSTVLLWPLIYVKTKFVILISVSLGALQVILNSI